MIRKFFRHINEQIQREALKQHYKELEKMTKNKNHIKRCQKFARVYYPSFCILFVVCFWVLGINHASQA